MTVVWDPPSLQAGDPPVTTYQVQYRVNQEQWLLGAESVSALVRNSVRAVQDVTTRAMEGSYIDSGSFTLSFNFEVRSLDDDRGLL